MRCLAIAAALAAIPAISFAATPKTDGSGRQRYNDYYYKSYDTAFEPICVTRKIRATDAGGRPVVTKVRVCR